MQIAKILSVVLVTGLLCLDGGQVAHAQTSPRITGTYTDMYYDKESGDLLGEELKIVLTQGAQYQGVLQFAEGEPEDLIVVDIDVAGTTISFSIPDNDIHAGRFTGTIAGNVLRGQFRFKKGGVQNVALRKGKSYWD
jgi:hypothetical protein